MEMSLEILIPVIAIAVVLFFVIKGKKPAVDREFTPDNPDGGGSVKSDSQSKVVQK